jgi:hypothetical protein
MIFAGDENKENQIEESEGTEQGKSTKLTGKQTEIRRL